MRQIKNKFGYLKKGVYICIVKFTRYIFNTRENEGTGKTIGTKSIPKYW
jgi:hypothetical protein